VALVRLRIWIAAAVIFCVFAAIYLATPTSNYTFDAVNYAHMIRLSEESGPATLFHPHHLAFNGAGLVSLRALRLFIPGIDPLHALQVMNALAGALGLSVLFLVLRRMLLDTAPEGSRGRYSTAIAAVSAAVLGLTFGWWIASTDGRPYIPPITPLLGAFYFAYRMAKTGSSWSAAGFGGMLGITVLLHQSHGLFLIVGIAAVMLAPTNLKARFQLVGLVFLSLLLVAGIPYSLVIRLRDTQTVSEAVAWALTYAKLGVWWDFDIISNLPKDYYALRHVFLAEVPENVGKFSFMLIAAADVIMIFSFLFVLLGLTDRILGYCQRQRHRRVHERLLGGYKGGSVGELKERTDPMFIFNVLAVTWIISYAAFFTVWTPGFFPFWIPVAAALVMLVVVNSSSGSARRLVLTVTIIAAVSLGIINLWFYILPKIPKETNASILIAEKVKANTPTDSLVIVTGMGYMPQMEVYLPYFAERETISLHQVMIRHKSKGIDWLTQRIAQHLLEGKKVYVFGEVFDSPRAWNELEARYGLNREHVRQAISRFNPKKRFRVSDQPVYELRYPDEN